MSVRNNMKARLDALRSDRSGMAAIFFALSVPVLVGSVGFAIDFTNYRLVAGRMQSAADAGALAGVKALDAPTKTVSEAVKFAQLNVPGDYGNVTINSDVTVGNFSTANGFVPGVGPTANAVRVRAERSPDRGNAAHRIMSVFWGPDDVSMSVAATAARQLNVQYEPPERFLLDNNAWDYNEVYAYCYDKNATGNAAAKRSQMTLVGNNWNPNEQVTDPNNSKKKIKRGSVITRSNGRVTDLADDPLVWPKCDKQGQSLSFRLRNIREVKQPGKLATATQWSNAGEYNHYTDTTISAGVETYGGLGETILESVRCDTMDKCDPSKSGAQVPKGTNRTPKVEKQPCLPGKFMYFGWEDRPPSSGSDKDYDDITMVMKCPKDGLLGDGKTRLVG